MDEDPSVKHKQDCGNSLEGNIAVSFDHRDNGNHKSKSSYHITGDFYNFLVQKVGFVCERRIHSFH